AYRSSKQYHCRCRRQFAPEKIRLSPVAEIRSITKKFFRIVEVGDVKAENPIADRYTQQVIVVIEKLESIHRSTDGIVAIFDPQVGLYTRGDLFIWQINEVYPVPVDDKEKRAPMQLDQFDTGHLQIGIFIYWCYDIRNRVLFDYTQRQLTILKIFKQD